MLWCQCSRHGSADDIHGLHKSVSFSGRPEVASFNVSQPVCSLHATLKNRRRNMRRREQRRRVASFNKGTSDADTEDMMSACSSASRGRGACAGGGRGRGFLPRQRHYSDSFLMTDFVNPNDFELHEKDKDCDKTKEVAFELSNKKGRKRRKQPPAKAPSDPEQAQDSQTPTSEGEKKEKSADDSSALSWKDDAKCQRSSEHRTHCPIEFENADVFALDDD